MVDATLDALLDAVRELTRIVLREIDSAPSHEQKLIDILKNLDVMIAQRKGRPDDQPESH